MIKFTDLIAAFLKSCKSMKDQPSDALDPEELRENQSVANLHAQRFVGQECIFREKSFTCLAILSDLKVDDVGYRAELTLVEHHGFFNTLGKKAWEVGSTWRKGIGGRVEGAIIFGGAFASYQIYSDPDVVRKAKQIALEHSSAGMLTRSDALDKHLDKAAGWLTLDDDGDDLP